MGIGWQFSGHHFLWLRPILLISIIINSPQSLCSSYLSRNVRKLDSRRSRVQLQSRARRLLTWRPQRVPSRSQNRSSTTGNQLREARWRQSSRTKEFNVSILEISAKVLPCALYNWQRTKELCFSNSVRCGQKAQENSWSAICQSTQKDRFPI